MDTLDNILRQFSEDYCKTELIQKILNQSVSRRAEWAAWSRALDTVPQECRAIMSVLSTLMEKGERDAFAGILIDIAVAVAMAFREGQPPAPNAGPKAILQTIIGAVTGKKEPTGGPLAHANVSATERMALQRLADALGSRL